ncbi:MAG TPA: tetratricopeptide repeat protein [Longimicrobiaceae bacterium]|nr:tetratricopeptide repeat protein [Longimicrobiaceae bacterium]
MSRASSLPTTSARPTVLVLEAPRGPARLERLQRWAASRTRAGKVWLLPCDRDTGGVWAGVEEWISGVLPDLELRAPDLFLRHDSELTQVVPALCTRVRPRYVNLTDASNRDEAVRNYSADRVRRIPHGIIDLLAAWHERTGGAAWSVACDDFDRRGPIVGRFFRELVRRRGRQLGLTLLAAVSPGAAEETARELASFARVRIIRLTLAPAANPLPDRDEAARRAAEMEAWVKRDTLWVRMHAHTLANLWRAAGRPERVAYWTMAEVGILTQFGYYEDAFRGATAVERDLACFDDADAPYSRAAVVNKLYTVYLTVGLTERARAVLQREGLDRLTAPVDRAHALYQMAMLHARFLPSKDLAAAEACLQEALAELEHAELEPADRHFHTVFLLNGLAFVRVRLGNAAEAVEMTTASHARLDEHLPPGRHRLHRSVLLYNAAQVYAQNGEHESALEYLSAAMEMDPYYSEYYNDRGSIYLKTGRLAEAEADYRRAIEMSAPYPEVWYNLGQCLTRAGRLSEAAAAYERAVDLDPTRPQAWAGLAAARRAMGDAPAALAAYDAAIAADDANPFLLANRGSLRLERGDVDGGLADLDAAASRAPDNPALRRNREIALAALEPVPA